MENGKCIYYFCFRVEMIWMYLKCWILIDFMFDWLYYEDLLVVLIIEWIKFLGEFSYFYCLVSKKNFFLFYDIVILI